MQQIKESLTLIVYKIITLNKYYISLQLKKNKYLYKFFFILT